MVKLTRTLETVANLAIIVVAASVAGFLVTKAVIPAGADRTSSERNISPGMKVSLSNINWRGNHNTLLFVVAKGCHYCSESAPFYQELLSTISGRNDVKAIAVVPGTESEGRAYLAGLGLSMSDVRQAPLEQIGVRGTPTLVLVNGSGVATAVWVGELASETESEVLAKLGALSSN